MKNNLDDLRQSIDNIDDTILALLAERFRLTHKVGVLKKQLGLPAVDKQRENNQFTKITQRSQKIGLNPAITNKIWRLVIDEVVKNHNAIKESERKND